MGVKQSKRSVDITEISTKGEIEGFGNEGKVEKIIDGVVEKVAANGHVEGEFQNGVEGHQNGLEPIQNGEAAAVATEKITEKKDMNDSPSEGTINGQMENGEVHVEAEKTEEHKKSEEKKDKKKEKKEKVVKKKFSFRNFSFSKKDKSKPPKEEKSPEKVDEVGVEILAELFWPQTRMEVQLKDESGKTVESLLEKSIALTNEVQVNRIVEPQEILKDVEIDLATVPEHNVLKTNPAAPENDAPGAPAMKENVQDKIVSAVNSAMEVVVGGVKGIVDTVTQKEVPEDIKVVTGEAQGPKTSTDTPIGEAKEENVMNALANNAKQLYEGAIKTIDGAADELSAKLGQAEEALSKKVNTLTSSVLADSEAEKVEVEQKIKDATDEVNSALKQLMQDFYPCQTSTETAEPQEGAIEAKSPNEGEKVVLPKAVADGVNSLAETSVPGEITNADDINQKAAEIASKAVEAKDTLCEKIGSMIGSAKNAVEDQVAGAEQKLEGTVDSIRNAIVKGAEDTAESVEKLQGEGGEKLEQVKDVVVEKLESATETGKSADGMISSVTESVQNAAEVMRDAGEEAKSNAADAVKKEGEKLQESISAGAEDVKSGAGDALESLQTSVTQAIDGSLQTVQKVTDEVSNNARDFIAGAAEKKDAEAPTSPEKQDVESPPPEDLVKTLNHEEPAKQESESTMAELTVTAAEQPEQESQTPPVEVSSTMSATLEDLPPPLPASPPPTEPPVQITQLPSDLKELKEPSDNDNLNISQGPIEDVVSSVSTSSLPQLDAPTEPIQNPEQIVFQAGKQIEEKATNLLKAVEERAEETMRTAADIPSQMAHGETVPDKQEVQDMMAENVVPTIPIEISNLGSLTSKADEVSDKAEEGAGECLAELPKDLSEEVTAATIEASNPDSLEIEATAPPPVVEMVTGE